MLSQNAPSLSGTEPSSSHFSPEVSRPEGSLLLSAARRLGSTAPFSHQTFQPFVPNQLDLDVQKVLRFSVAMQRAELLQGAGPSHHLHLEALDALEKRGFQPSPQAVLKVRVTGKALGGAPKRGVESRRQELSDQLNSLEVDAATNQESIDACTETLNNLRNMAMHQNSTSVQVQIQAQERALQKLSVEKSQLETKHTKVWNELWNLSQGGSSRS